MVKHQKLPKYYDHGGLQNLLLHFISLLTSPIVKNSHLLAGIYFIFLKERLRPNWKALQYQIWTSKKGSKKWLSSKTNSSTFLQFGCSNSSSHVKECTTGKVQFLFSRSLLLVFTKFTFWTEDWVLGYNSVKFWHYSELS